MGVPGAGIRPCVGIASAFFVLASIAACADSTGPHDLVLRAFGRPLPTRVAALPQGLSVSPRSVSCRAATVTGVKPARYSVVVTENDFLHIARSMPPRYITVSMRVRTPAHTYQTYLDSYDVGYEPPRISIRPQLVSEQHGGAPMGGIFVPGATKVSRKLLLAGQNSNFDHDPATTFTMDEIPTACDIIVHTGYRPGQIIEIPLVP